MERERERQNSVPLIDPHNHPLDLHGQCPCMSIWYIVYVTILYSAYYSVFVTAKECVLYELLCFLCMSI